MMRRALLAGVFGLMATNAYAQTSPINNQFNGLLQGLTTQLSVGLTTIPTITAGGASYVNGDTITLNDGCSGTVNGIVQAHAVLTVSNASGGVIQAAGVTITTAGVCATPPLNPVAQLSSSGSGTGATFTPGGAAWAGTYTITQPRFTICGIGGGGGAGGVSNVNAAAGAPGNAGTMVCARYTGQTIGGTIAYTIGFPGVAGAAGNNNGVAGGNTTFGTITMFGGPRGLGSASGNAAVTGTAVLDALLPVLPPTSSVAIVGVKVSVSVGGTSSGQNGMSSPWGAGGAVASSNVTGGTATGYGAGGGAPAWATSGGSGSGYAGGAGSGGALFALVDHN